MFKTNKELQMIAYEYTVKFLTKRLKYCTSAYELNKVADNIHWYVHQWEQAYRKWRKTRIETI